MPPYLFYEFISLLTVISTPVGTLTTIGGVGIGTIIPIDLKLFAMLLISAPVIASHEAAAIESRGISVIVTFKYCKIMGNPETTTQTIP